MAPSPAESQAAPRPALTQALTLMDSDPARAEALAREVLAGAPDDPQARLILGGALRAQGRLGDAQGLLQPLAAALPQSWLAQAQWALWLADSGQSQAALAPLERALALNPGFGQGWRLLGDIRLVCGEVAAAQHAYDRLLVGLVHEPRLASAAIALAEGRIADADARARAILAKSPANLGAGHILAEALARQGHTQEAEILLAQCVARAPGQLQIGQSYALALMRNGRFETALELLHGLLTTHERDIRCMVMGAAALAAIDDYEAATATTAAILERFPDQPQAWLIQGNSLRTLGRISEAIDAYRHCLAHDPGCGEAYWSLANLKTYRLDAAERAGAQAQLDRADLPAHERSLLHFTLGKACEDAGADEAAFAHYQRANALQRSQRAYDPEATHALVARAKALFTPAFLEARQDWGAAAADPIFIVGLPRSGSTLVEQILASHPQVEGTRELLDIQGIADWLGGARAGYPGAIADLTPELCRRLGEDYLEATRGHRRLGRPRFTDKAPWNALHTGLIALILPNARIVDVRRHPLGCCVSAFRQHFDQGFDFTYDLADLGRYYADYVDLMAHFDAVAPGRVHRVIYEDLVADTEGQVRRLLAYLGLPFDPACLRFFDNPRAVATPSSEQVRRPVFTDAVDHWRRFEPWLGPLKAALGPVLGAYPQAPGR